VLRQVLPALQVMGGSGDQLEESAEPSALDGTGRLGDFRLVREVGRGGMGVVYEAEQISLGRRVALKVLPFAATMDPRGLQRFQNEARAAACLHHTNIVPVFAVGQERGVHYYAMQLIEGQTLGTMIHDLQQLGRKETPRGKPDPADLNETTPYAGPALSPGLVPPPIAASTAPRWATWATSTEGGIRDAAYFRTVAQLGTGRSGRPGRPGRSAPRKQSLGQLPEGHLVSSLIRKTKSHDAGGDADAQVLLDADLAILGASQSDYQAYAERIRCEYAWVPEPEYRKGRREVLKRFLARPRIFHFLSQLEEPARQNLAAEIARLA
jgi:Protein kinase domain